MSICIGIYKTKDRAGQPCDKRASKGSQYCSYHKNQGNFKVESNSNAKYSSSEPTKKKVVSVKDRRNDEKWDCDSDEIEVVNYKEGLSSRRRLKIANSILKNEVKVRESKPRVKLDIEDEIIRDYDEDFREPTISIEEPTDIDDDYDFTDYDRTKERKEMLAKYVKLGLVHVFHFGEDIAKDSDWHIRGSIDEVMSIPSVVEPLDEFIYDMIPDDLVEEDNPLMLFAVAYLGIAGMRHYKYISKQQKEEEIKEEPKTYSTFNNTKSQKNIPKQPQFMPNSPYDTEWWRD